MKVDKDNSKGLYIIEEVVRDTPKPLTGKEKRRARRKRERKNK